MPTGGSFSPVFGSSARDAEPESPNGGGGGDDDDHDHDVPDDVDAMKPATGLLLQSLLKIRVTRPLRPRKILFTIP